MEATASTLPSWATRTGDLEHQQGQRDQEHLVGEERDPLPDEEPPEETVLQGKPQRQPEQAPDHREPPRCISAFTNGLALPQGQTEG